MIAKRHDKQDNLIIPGIMLIMPLCDHVHPVIVLHLEALHVHLV